MPSNFLPELVHANQEYQEIWRDKDESTNLDQGPYFDMIETEKTREVENEVRVGVDQALRGYISQITIRIIEKKLFLVSYLRQNS